MKQIPTYLITALSLAMAGPLSAETAAPVHMANGIKIGEVSATTAIVWTRLTRNPERNPTGIPSIEGTSPATAISVGELPDAVPGAPGEIRVSWSLDGQTAGTSEWLPVDPAKDHTRQVTVKGLAPGSRYQVEVSSRATDGKVGQKVSGALQTAPATDQTTPVHFTVVTGQEFNRRDDPENGHKIYKAMLATKPDFFVHTGDIVYYDKRAPNATSAPLARYKWNRMYAMPFQRSFHNNVASYFMKDDHDTVKNDCWPEQSYGDLTWDQGLEIFREQVPMGKSTYRTVRWGKDLQLWFVEGRDFRSPNKMPDGPDKTIWGERQKAWFYDTVRKSDATFRILISPTPIVGPDRGNKNDNHANKGFTHEGDEIRSFISKQKNMLVLCGDRHWQYVSKDPKTGVREYSCGPTSNVHAGGFREKNRSSMHQYLNVKGGFLSVRIKRDAGKPVAIFQHHGVDGSLYNEDIITAN